MNLKHKILNEVLNALFNAKLDHEISLTTTKCRFNIVRLTSVFDKIDVKKCGGKIVNNMISLTSFIQKMMLTKS